MRYNQDASNSPLSLEAPPQPSPFLSLIPPPPVPAFTESGASYYNPTPHVFPGVDVRPRLGSNTTPSPGMAHAPRSTTLPHPGPTSTRDIYLPATPGLRRLPDHHTPRSPSFPSSIRRNPLSPTPASSIGYVNPLRMEPPYPSKQTQNIPPLGTLVTLGTLSYTDAQQTKIAIDISGTIDKGFFIADQEWTCYRRNYFSCICSYSLSPWYQNEPKQFTLTGSQTPYPVAGFAMSISAVVADNEDHTIELVQHTPKRDKGPTSKPEKVRLTPKPSQPSHHPLAIYGDQHGLRSSGYEGGYGPQQSLHANEHTFERIQFKQATANNGKRRAAQQYYHLVVELWAEIAQSQGSTHGGDQFVRVAYKKSAKMIVRGRSPGHYQTERRGSTSSGPGSGGGSMGGGYQGGVLPGNEYSSGSGAMMNNPYSSYDARPGGYSGGSHRSHADVTMEPLVSEEMKVLAESKAGYQYYPHTLYENNDHHQDIRQHQHQHQNQNQHQHQQQSQSQPQQHHQHQPSHHPHQVELFSPSTITPRHDNDHHLASHIASKLDNSHASRVKTELDGGLPPMFYTGVSYQAGCGRFEGKPTSTGYYPTPAMMQ